MDYTHFGFRTRPFRAPPDVEGYYPATGHEASIAELRRGLADEEGLLLLSGEPGTGKTLSAHRLIEGMPEGARTVLLTNGSFQQRAELLQAILFDLGLPYQEMSEQELRLSLYESCLDHFRKLGPSVIVVDEAHLLPPSLLEELRLFGNLEGREGKAVQVVLIGLPSIMDAIEQPGLEVFRQRLAVHCKLARLSIEESADYLLHQIRRAGGRPEQLLGEDVLDILSHACRGIPRLLNQAAHLAFTLAAESGSYQVDAEAAVESVSRLGLDDVGSEADASLEQSLPEAIELDRETPAIAALMPPTPPAAIHLVREDGPPIFVYGGVIEADCRAPTENGPRNWQSTPQRAG